MPIEASLSDQHIIDCLHTHYGINIITLTLLPFGAVGFFYGWRAIIPK